MSQEKVDKYKKEKADRKKNIKLQNVARKCVVGVIGIALIGWIGYSAYDTYQSNRPVDEVQIDYTAMDELPQELAAAQEADAAAAE